MDKLIHGWDGVDATVGMVRRQITLYDPKVALSTANTLPRWISRICSGFDIEGSVDLIGMLENYDVCVC